MIAKAGRRGLTLDVATPAGALSCRHHLCSLHLRRLTHLFQSNNSSHSSHFPHWTPLKKICLQNGPSQASLHPKKAPRRLSPLSAGSSSSWGGAVFECNTRHHTSSVEAETLTGRCKSHERAPCRTPHINSGLAAVWFQSHHTTHATRLGTQSIMGSHGYLPPKSAVDQGSGSRTDTRVLRKNSRTPWGRRRGLKYCTFCTFKMVLLRRRPFD